MSQSAFFPKAEFLGLEFDCPTFDEMIAWLSSRKPGDELATIVTPNVDHVVGLDREPEWRTPLYRDATFCLCDSRVLSRLARLSGINLSVLPGSDLAATLFERVLCPGDKIAIVGSNHADIQILGARYPDVEILHYVPPMGLRTNTPARAEAASWASATAARFTLLAVGAPQQELLAWELGGTEANSGTILCIGASIDFLTGTQRRAPLAMQRLGVEWLWRLASDPRRLAKRYLWDDLAILRIVLVRWLARKKLGTHAGSGTEHVP